jgi:hypothetical protein
LVAPRVQRLPNPNAKVLAIDVKRTIAPIEANIPAAAAEILASA